VISVVRCQIAVSDDCIECVSVMAVWRLLKRAVKKSDINDGNENGFWATQGRL